MATTLAQKRVSREANTLLAAVVAGERKLDRRGLVTMDHKAGVGNKLTADLADIAGRPGRATKEVKAAAFEIARRAVNDRLRAS